MKGARLYLDLFKVFQDLAHTKSFSKAAGQNYITQSAVSQQLSFLEKHFGQKLIDRGKGKFTLTEGGQVLLETSSKLLDVYQQSVDALQHKGEISGVVMVQTVYSIGLHPLTLFVKTFMRRFPKVNLRVEFQRSDHIYSNVLQGLCDIGIVAYPWAHPLLQVMPFQKEKLVVICAPENPLASHGKTRLAHLDHRNFIGFNKDIPTRRAVDEMLRKHGVFVNMVQEFDNIETLKRSVEIGAGVSIVPENTVLQEIRNKTLSAVPLAGGPFYRPTGIIHRKDRSLSRATKEFIGWLLKK